MCQWANPWSSSKLQGCLSVSDPNNNNIPMEIKVSPFQMICVLHKKQQTLLCSLTWPEASCTLTHNFHTQIFLYLCPLAVLSLNNLLHCRIVREGTVVIKTSVCLCVNGESVLTGSAALSMSIIVRKAMATQGSVWECQAVLSNSVGKKKYLSQVHMWTADKDLAASQPFDSTAASSSNTTPRFLPYTYVRTGTVKDTV